jgi:hypothetical protein
MPAEFTLSFQESLPMLKPSLLLQSALIALCSFALLWTAPATADQPQADPAKFVYICGCGTEVGCNVIFAEPGQAPCGRPLIERQVLKEDAAQLYVCACPESCKCGLNPDDPSKCACGKALRVYPKPGTQVTGSAHHMPVAAQPPCAGCPKHADCAGCPKAKAAEVQAPCANCPKHADCPGCPKMPEAAAQPPCANCPKMPAAAQ